MNENEWMKRLAERTDLTTQLMHLTKGSNDPKDENSVVNNLLKIISDKKLIGSDTDGGFICGPNRAVCFQDTPLYSLMQNVYYEKKLRDSGQQTKVRYLGWGLLFPKRAIFIKGGRPVIYDKTNEAKDYLPESQWWRIVNLNLENKDSLIDWTHEREWRIKGDFEFNLSEVIVIVFTSKLGKTFLKKYKEKFNSEAFNDLKGIISLGEIFL
jgi:hypothetical protein